MGYKPCECSKYCPYADKCTHDVNLCLTLKGRKRITRSDPAERYVDVNESYDCMEQSLKIALESGRDGMIHLIYGQTGVGKSTAYKTLLRKIRTPVIIAVPTVALKREVYSDLADIAVEMPSLKDLALPYEVERTVSSLYERGLHKEAKYEISKYAKTLNGPVKQDIEDYLKARDKVDGKHHVIMTHAQLMHLPDSQVKNYKIIIDEDILFSLLKNTKKVAVQDVETALQCGIIRGERARELLRLITDKKDCYMKSSADRGVLSGCNYFKAEVYNDAGIDGNINDLLSAGSYHYDVENNMMEYYTPPSIPGSSWIVMSATMNEDVYRMFFRNKEVKAYHTPKAAYTGRLIQYTYHSMSRADIAKKVDEIGSSVGFFEAMKKSFEDLAGGFHYMISFKQYSTCLTGGLYFGNAAGIDRFKGKNGMIIGTPHYTENCYKLIGAYLGLNVNSEKAKLRRQKVRYGGYEFYMMTYKDECLRKLQLYMISSELEQCIGRSRLLRENATVYLFSNFPCEQAELIQDDYWILDDTDTSVGDVPA